MKRKIIGIFVITLLIASMLPISAQITIKEKRKDISDNSLDVGWYKTLVIGVVILFFGMSTQSVIAFVQSKTGIDSHSKLIEEPKLGENECPKKIGEYDNYTEIITWVSGDFHYSWKLRRGIFRGSIGLGTCPRCKGIDLIGLRLSNGKLEKYSEYEIDAALIYRFIGIPEANIGIAIGNIDWKYV